MSKFAPEFRPDIRSFNQTNNSALHIDIQFFSSYKTSNHIIRYIILSNKKTGRKIINE